ncbi:MAG: M23 family metallopeptidase, partial [candidate division Zixibacteria bacterium]|nr:M23 family metallopeptidase [candidate division Zixibacteria bacterium]
MLKKRLTLLIVPDSSGVSKQLCVPVWSLVAGCALLLTLLFASFFLASAFFVDQVDKSELDRLKQENAQMAEKYETLRWNLAETDSRYSELVNKEIALRTIFDLPEIDPEERQLGIGGPSAPITVPVSETQMLAYRTEAEVDRLLRLSRFELEKYGEVEDLLTDLKDRLDHTPSIWPTKGWNSSGFGMRHDPFTGYKSYHRGLDIANKAGTPIIAPADGKVKEYGTYGNMGKMLVIDHGYGFVTRYGHLASVDVKRGERVKRGQVVATMGNSGYTTGPHL